MKNINIIASIFTVMAITACADTSLKDPAFVGQPARAYTVNPQQPVLASGENNWVQVSGTSNMNAIEPAAGGYRRVK